MISLEKISEENFKECINLDPGVTNEDFADSVAYSLAEAWIYYPDMKPFAISMDGELIGFALLYLGEENFQIINFFIVKGFRDRGYGRQAARLCIDYLKDVYKVDRISVPVDCRNYRALKFWRDLGFEESKNIEDGYVFMRCHL
ncbi:GNAT family N-acetyltransferase [Anaerococcus sp. Marseille-Q7828]|uniref:GNAT family N-acetyltransferase n=1 Tax=Anaerococcus sp. Marseille-Q7828 TaxID=3036300 RepID=UPI0024AE611A|nr:GNAT family N-acetyltransferase [Anaerococcus sp. Marseille-Q7828]